MLSGTPYTTTITSETYGSAAEDRRRNVHDDQQQQQCRGDGLAELCYKDVDQVGDQSEDNANANANDNDDSDDEPNPRRAHDRWRSGLRNSPDLGRRRCEGGRVGNASAAGRRRVRRARASSSRQHQLQRILCIEQLYRYDEY